ncbi:aromatic ring-hydroxylating dioxygenase subunit alpha [Bradyrhizobium sp. ARR65]|uniref:aromatic ring-hydroxylating oxygenase subunit alpha n=1 Tax=Bradyrhizobium sp. ARR65 TaxID=1040989 RepID=UPI000557D567|nr:aromatic ring-hydroxylating dioxygenase subunit alpha [Bradyrhizobium sp. ARR65]
MVRTDDPVALNEWYAIETLSDVTASPRRTRLLGQDLLLYREDGAPNVKELDAAGRPGKALPVRERYGCLWTSIGTPSREIFEIPEAAEPDRRFVICGWVKMRTSAPRMIENFLDMAHFPYVHNEILGAEPHTEVPAYESEIRRDVDEVWATNCRFFQPRIAVTESSGDFVKLTYRVPSPFAVMLYRACPSAPSRLDAIAMFIQPIEEELCRAQPVMFLVDVESAHNDLLTFEQVIFLQDRIVVENQRPLRLPLEPRAEIPTRADSSSVAYRRWLKEKGLRYGTIAGSL